MGFIMPELKDATYRSYLKIIAGRVEQSGIEREETPEYYKAVMVALCADKCRGIRSYMANSRALEACADKIANLTP